MKDAGMPIITLKTILAGLKTSLERHRRLAAACLLAVWALAQLWLGEWVYASFIIIFSLLLLFLPRRAALGLVVGTALVLIFTRIPVWDGLTHLVQTDAQFVQNPPANLREIMAPNTGLKETLPILVQHILLILQKHPLAAYSLAGEKFKDDLIHERIVESTWPVRLDPASKDVFVLSEDMPLNSTCRLVDQWKDVALVHCP